MRSVRTLLFGGLAGAVIIGVCAYFLVRQYVLDLGAVERQAMQQAFEKHHEDFLRDQAVADELALFPTTLGERNAGPFLNPRLIWSGDEAAIAAFRRDNAAAEKALELPAALSQALNAETWPDLPSEEVASLSFAWLTELRHYDHWDIENDSPVERLEVIDMSTLPMPEFTVLLRWAKARLLHGVGGDLNTALDETRHLAALCYSTESLIGGMVAATILGFEASLRQRAAGMPGAERMLASDTTDRLKRCLFAAPAYAQRDTPAEVAASLDTLAIGRCAALNESLWLEATFLRPLLESVYAESYNRLTAHLEASRDVCRLGRLRQAWSDDSALRARFDPSSNLCDTLTLSSGTTDASGGFCWLDFALPLMPGAERMVGEILASVASPDWFRRYNQTQ